jgi:hypothetical protein
VFLAAVYIRNRIWSQGSRTIPYLAVTGHKPDFTNLRILGCPTYVHIDKNNKKKFDKTAWQGIFVCYCSDSLAYLIYNTRTRHVLRSRCVTINKEWLTHRDRSSACQYSARRSISGEELPYYDIGGNNSAPQHNATLGNDIPTSGEEQPIIAGEDQPLGTGEQP